MTEMERVPGRFVCPNGHQPEEVVLTVPCLDDDHPAREIGIVVAGDGTPTNHWGDGCVGVSQALYDLAQDETEGWCPECDTFTEWRRDPPDAIGNPERTPL